MYPAAIRPIPIIGWGVSKPLFPESPSASVGVEKVEYRDGIRNLATAEPQINRLRSMARNMRLSTRIFQEPVREPRENLKYCYKEL